MTSDHRYNRSEKGRARYARYREAHREEIRARDRAFREAVRNDPVRNIRRAIYMSLYRHRKRSERYSQAGLALDLRPPVDSDHRRTYPHGVNRYGPATLTRPGPWPQGG